jgi:Tfp pilus assembly pilus retraction ATPase PilT
MQKAKTIRLTEQDKQAIARLRDYYALSSDNEAIRFALKQALRAIEQQSLPPHSNKERPFYPRG